MQDTPHKKTLKTVQYRRIEKGFGQWLDTLGYAASTVYGMPRMLNEFLQWLEEKGITEIKEIQSEQVKAFISYFKNRPNQRRAGGVSISHVNKQIDTLQKLFKYLKATKQAELNIPLKFIKEEERPERTILSKEEIQQLYQATDNSPIGMRDRAMLAVYYGCGIRKSEGTTLEVSDILFERRLLYVRKAKNQHERYVPINLKCLQDLEIYIYTARPLLLNETATTETLFISANGVAMQGQSMIVRLKALQKKTGNPELQNKSFGLHALRHSIATHLLRAGMELENIALFLGHKTLDSTQRYTHIINEQ